MSDETRTGTRRLIEDWLPIAEIGIESLRERTPMTPFPAPNRLHVWFARRPLIASRAAVLASLLPADADRAKFTHALGIHGDPVAAKAAITEAVRTGVRVENPYTYPRAFLHSPTEDERGWIASEAKRAGLQEMIVLDSTAGGGSIPFEAARLGSKVIANELNAVAWLVLKATVEFPARFGTPLLKRYKELAKIWRGRLQERLAGLYPVDPDPDIEDATYLWSRTIRCPYCDGTIPLSPNWKLDGKGKGVRLVPHVEDPADRHFTFEIVETSREHSAETVKGGVAVCPFPDCGRVVDGDEVKAQAQAGAMGQQLYAVVFKRQVIVGHTKAGKPKIKAIRGYRSPRPEDDNEQAVRAAFEEKLPGWRSRDIIPDEEVPPGNRSRIRDRTDLYGLAHWTDFFSPRQLYGHCSSVEVFREIVEEIQSASGGELNDLDRAALAYLSIAIDKLLGYNARMVRWHSSREVVAGVFDRHDFSFKWSFAEIAPTIAGVGLDWAVEQTGKSLDELIELSSGEPPSIWNRSDPCGCSKISINLGSADAMDLSDASVDALIMDPPYYDNVTYSELSDYYYVWLKRTVGLLYPEEFTAHLTDKDREAVANPFRFLGQRGMKELAGKDYQDRMAAIFKESRRVLKPDGIMTVMFTHKAMGAWDALTSALVEAGFVITASWPVNTEAEGSLHIKEKSAAKSTIFLVCRGREAKPDADPAYWEDIEPKVATAVRERVGTFQEAGIGGIDLYLASFGPALQVFSEAWPLTRGRPVVAAEAPKGRGKKRLAEAQADPYAVRPEDALDAARREVKRWRMEQLATIRRKGNLEGLTEWFILAWDAFKAPKFPTDEALKLARVVGLDFDREVKNVLGEAKGDDMTLWDSLTRQRKGKLGVMRGAATISVLHLAAALGIAHGTEVARDALEQEGLLQDERLMMGLEATLNVLPPPSLSARKVGDGGLAGASNDFLALERLRRLAFSEAVPPPRVDPQLLLF